MSSEIPVPVHPIPQEAFDWYDEYAHGLIDRRTFLNRLGTLTSASLTMGMLLPALLPDILDAGVPFYGTPAAPEIRDQVKGPLLVQLAELDKRVNASWPEYEETLKKNGAAYTMHLYPGANHGFHNDSTGRYDKEQAELAWERTLAFFRKQLA